jgi:hypothetical protein
MSYLQKWKSWFRNGPGRSVPDMTVPIHEAGMTGVGLRRKRGRDKEIDSKLNGLFANTAMMVLKWPDPDCRRSHEQAILGRQRRKVPCSKAIDTKMKELFSAGEQTFWKRPWPAPDIPLCHGRQDRETRQAQDRPDRTSLRRSGRPDRAARNTRTLAKHPPNI